MITVSLNKGPLNEKNEDILTGSNTETDYTTGTGLR